MFNIQTSRCIVLVALLVIFIPIAIFVYKVAFTPNYVAKENPVKKHKTILLYNEFFDQPNWDFPANTNGPEFFKSINCSVTNCVITTNHSYLPSIDNYDVLMFHYSDYRQTMVCPKNTGQIFIFFVMESPVYTQNRVCPKDNYYSFTLTYRRDSDVLAVYGGIYDIESGQLVAPKPVLSKIEWRTPEMAYSSLENSTLYYITMNKKKMAAWFVSHCNAASKRDELAETLKKYINVDVFGNCGTMSLTMTYRLDSDARAVYGAFADIKTGDLVAPKPYPLWRLPERTLSSSEEEKFLAITTKKSKMAAWFVSHCNVSSQRDKLVKVMQKYINVDIYGNYGTLSCPRKSNKCTKMLDDDYKFYFSFENSLCVDYVTEKFYEALERYIVPVVLGGADYSLFAPPHSYINVDDFNTVEDLANYLKYLDNNPNEYIKYFWWKKHYKVLNMYMAKYCELCKKLNEPDALHPKRLLKLDWWYNNTCYDNPKIKLV